MKFKKCTASRKISGSAWRCTLPQNHAGLHEYVKSYQKYGNKTYRCAQGHLHQSIGESGYCDTLHLMLRAKEIKSVKQQPKYPLDVNGHHICNHIVDFEVVNKQGVTEVHEFKGFATKLWDMKHKLFKAIYPKIPYIVVKR